MKVQSHAAVRIACGLSPELPARVRVQPIEKLPELARAAMAAKIEKIPCDFSMRPTTDEAKLNKTERAWLDVLRYRGHENIGIQDLTLKLSDDCRYTPEFRVVVSGRLKLYEVKGKFIREDAWIKLKTAARLFREFDFLMAQDVGTSRQREWIETPIKP